MKNKICRPKPDGVDIHVTEHGGKMEGMPSVSTPCTMNPLCRKLASIPGSVCSHCYAQRLIGFRRNIQPALARNLELFAGHGVIPVEKFPNFEVPYVRVESFGDVTGLTHARNYINMMLASPGTVFSVYTKHPGLYRRAYRDTGKPGNMVLNVSSLFLNEPCGDPGPDVDHVFTVYDKEHAKTVEINCGGKSCARCLTCYCRGGPFNVNELLK